MNSHPLQLLSLSEPVLMESMGWVGFVVIVFIGGLFLLGARFGRVGERVLDWNDELGHVFLIAVFLVGMSFISWLLPETPLQDFATSASLALGLVVVKALEFMFNLYRVRLGGSPCLCPRGVWWLLLIILGGALWMDSSVFLRNRREATLLEQPRPELSPAARRGVHNLLQTPAGEN
ncbi:MAG: hypothetical protein LAT83_19110 [Kiritimatiellae bacterium]|nr:hypothetical protein [Kiritimatiellia bacterium]